MDEQRVWHGLKSLLDASITLECSVSVFPDRIPGSVVVMANIQQSRTPEQSMRIPDKKASQMKATTSWFLCSPK
jgi:hypothetical protein